MPKLEELRLSGQEEPCPSEQEDPRSGHAPKRLELGSQRPKNGQPE